jgi:hypothetical protein
MTEHTKDTDGACSPCNDRLRALAGSTTAVEDLLAAAREVVEAARPFKRNAWRDLYEGSDEDVLDKATDRLATLLELGGDDG